MKTFLTLAALAAALPTAVLAQDASPRPADDFAGARVEAHVGYETPTVNDSAYEGDYKLDSAVAAGGEIGYDVALGDSLVAGPYAVFETSGVKWCLANTCLDEKHNWAVGGRLGYVLSPKVQLYGKLGYARIKFDASVGNLATDVSNSGVQGAIGVTYALSPRFYTFLEANYADNGKFLNGTLELKRRYVGTGIGTRF
jgi:outer membrane immunogenic protein